MDKKAVHEEILELLPWFINESLGDKERDLVMVHLRECAECRKERDKLQTIESFVKSNEVAVPDYKFSYQRLRSRIDEAERNRESISGWDGGFGRRKWVPYAGIAASLAFVVTLVGSFSPATDSTDYILPAESADEYRTLTTQTVEVGSKHRVALTFLQPIQAQTMREALIETNSNLVSGPDEEGTYIVEVNVPLDMSSEDLLRSMREIEGVEYAQLSPKVPEE
jgi:anti-sigma factor RsiW